MKLVLPVESCIAGRHNGPAWSRQVPGLDIHAFNWAIGPHQDLEALPFVPRGAQFHRAAAGTGRVIAEYAPALRNRPDLPVG
jgi:hypothetical protein